MRIRKVKGLLELHVHMGMFDYSVNVVVGDVKRLPKYVAHKFEEKEIHEQFFQFSTLSRGLHVFKSGFCPIIWIPSFPKTPREHATLAHESLHAVFDLMDWTGMKINHETEEVLTHAVGHIVTSVLEQRGRSA